MSFAGAVGLALMGLVFVVWAAQSYRILFRFRAREAERTGRLFPGPFSMLRQIGQWWRASEDRAERNRFLFLTFVLFAMIGLRVLTLHG